MHSRTALAESLGVWIVTTIRCFFFGIDLIELLMHVGFFGRLFFWCPLRTALPFSVDTMDRRRLRDRFEYTCFKDQLLDLHHITLAQLGDIPSDVMPANMVSFPLVGSTVPSCRPLDPLVQRRPVFRFAFGSSE